MDRREPAKPSGDALAEANGIDRASPIGLLDLTGQSVLLGLAEQGVDHVILSIRHPYPLDYLSLFAREVIPRVRRAGH